MGTVDQGLADRRVVPRYSGKAPGEYVPYMGGRRPVLERRASRRHPRRLVRRLPADLNQDDPEMARYMIQNVLWWVGMSGADGMRHNVVGLVPRTFWKKCFNALKQEHPGIRAVGEVNGVFSALLSQYRRDGRPSTAVPSGTASSAGESPLTSPTARIPGCSCLRALKHFFQNVRRTAHNVVAHPIGAARATHHSTFWIMSRPFRDRLG